MYMKPSAVDELVQIRTQIAELRARETALEAGFINAGDTTRFPGFAADVVVERNSYDVFDVSRLPRDMLNDDRFYRLKHVTTVRIEEHRESDAIPLFGHRPYTAIAGPAPQAE